MINIKKQKVIIFGTGAGGVIAHDMYKDTYNIVAFTGNDPNFRGGAKICSKPVIPPTDIVKMQYDLIIIANTYYDEIYPQLTQELNVPQNKIFWPKEFQYMHVRLDVLKNTAYELNRKQIKGAVAELGVYRGTFAKHINEFFPERILHLFDTFEGFDERDISKEMELAGDKLTEGNLEYIKPGHFNDTSVELVLSKMKYPKMCKIHKGYFPETTKNIDESERFCFVNVDVDLYQPLLAGMRFFYERLTPGGVMLVHDFYTDGWLWGVEQAFDKFLEEHRDARYVPVGDKHSIAILK